MCPYLFSHQLQYIYEFLYFDHVFVRQFSLCPVNFTFINEDTGCNPEDLPGAMNNREKW